MHVVLISDFAHVSGGAAKVAIEGAIALADRGHTITFLYAIEPVDERLQRDTITLVRVDADDVWSQSNPLQAARLAIWNDGVRRSVLSALRPVMGPDTVVHVHQWSRAFSPAVFRALGQLDVPVLVAMHDYFAVCPNGAYYHFDQRAPCQLSPMGLKCVASGCDRASRRNKAIRLLRHRRLQRELRALPNLTFTHVSDLAHEVAKPLSPSGVRHITVWNPVEPLGGAASAPWANEHVLYAGRLTAEKGVFDLAEVARRNTVPLAFLGDGPAGPELKRKYPEHRYVPWGDASTVGDALRACRALVLPSLWHETFGLVVLEALSVGTPVIVSDTVGAGAFVVDGTNGYVVPRGDMAMLADRLERCMDHDTLRELARGARSHTPFEYLSHKAHVDALERVYASAIADHGRLSAQGKVGPGTGTETGPGTETETGTDAERMDADA